MIPSLLPFVVLALLLVMFYVGLLLFPMIKSYMTHEDCVATGSTNCMPVH